MIIKFRENFTNETIGNTKEKCGWVESGGAEEGMVAIQKRNPYLSTQFSKMLRPATNVQNVICLNCAESSKGRRNNQISVIAFHNYDGFSKCENRRKDT